MKSNPQLKNFIEPYDREIQNLALELPQIEFQKGKIIHYNTKKESLNYWNEMSKKHLVLNTNLCSSEVAERIIQAAKK